MMVAEMTVGITIGTGEMTGGGMTAEITAGMTRGGTTGGGSVTATTIDETTAGTTETMVLGAATIGIRTGIGEIMVSTTAVIGIIEIPGTIATRITTETETVRGTTITMIRGAVETKRAIGTATGTTIAKRSTKLVAGT